MTFFFVNKKDSNKKKKRNSKRKQIRIAFWGFLRDPYQVRYNISQREPTLILANALSKNKMQKKANKPKKGRENRKEHKYYE